MTLANYANDQGCSYPSIDTLQRITRQDPKTIRSALTMLETDRFILDTGQRKDRTANVKVWKVLFPTLPDSVGLGPSSPKKPKADNGIELEEIETLPDSEGFDLNPTGSGSETLPDSVGEPVIEPIPPTPSVCAPRGGHTPDSRIPEDWLPPVEADLPERIAAIVAQWPPGAYADQALRFLDYWLTAPFEKAKRSDWHRMWYSWIRRAGRKVAAPAEPSLPLVPRVLQPLPPVAEQAAEGDREKLFRAAIIERNGHCPRWLERGALRFDDLDSEVGLTIYFAATRSEIEKVQGRVQIHAAAALGKHVRWISLRQGTTGLDLAAVVSPLV